MFILSSSCLHSRGKVHFLAGETRMRSSPSVPSATCSPAPRSRARRHPSLVRPCVCVEPSAHGDGGWCALNPVFVLQFKQALTVFSSRSELNTSMAARAHPGRPTPSPAFSQK